MQAPQPPTAKGSMTMDITATTAPRSDQQNFDDYAAGVARVVTITEVKAGSSEQPVEIHLTEFPGRPYKPSKSMRRVLVAAWGAEASEYAGRRMKLVGDPDVKFGGVVVGGIKIAALSHIDKPLKLALTVTRGKRAPHVVDPLPDAPSSPPLETTAERAAKAVDYFAGRNVSQSNLEAHVGKPIAEWDDADLADLKSNADSIADGAA